MTSDHDPTEGDATPEPDSTDHTSSADEETTPNDTDTATTETPIDPVADPAAAEAAGIAAGEPTLEAAAGVPLGGDAVAPEVPGADPRTGPLDIPAERAHASAGKGSRRGLFIIGGIVVLLLAIAAVAYAVVQNRIGSPDDALAAVPADATIVFSVDIRHFSEGDEFDRLVAAFEPIFEEADAPIRTLDDAIAEIDAALDEDAGVTLTDDVLPWIGRSIAVSVSDPDVVDTGAGLLVIASVRDEGAAGDFVEKLMSNDDVEYERRNVEGASSDAYVLEPDGGVGWLLIDNGLLTIAGDEETLLASRAALDSGDNITETDRYQAVVGELPEDRGIRLFVDGDMMTTLLAEAEETFGDLPEGEGAMVPEDLVIPDFAMGIGLTDLGIASDYVVLNEGMVAEASLLPPPLGAGLPADTLFYLGFGVETEPATVGGLLREQEGLYESIEEFETEFLGVDFLTRLVDQLTPQFAFAMTPSRGTMPMAGSLPLDVSALLSLGIADRAEMVTLVEDIVEWLEFAGLVAERDGDTWAIEIAPGSPLLVWTVTDDDLRLATDRDVLSRIGQDVTAGDTTETTETTEAETDSTDTTSGVVVDLGEFDDALPGDGINLYLDIIGIVDAFGAAGPETEVFAGFEAIAGSVEQRQNVTHAGFILKLAEPTSGGVDALGD